MVNVLVVGATGYIGQAVTHALTSSGDHTVYGLVRSAAKGKQLAGQEVTPVVGAISPGDESIFNAIDRNQIDVVIDVAGVFEGSRELLHTVKKAAAVRASKYGDSKGPKLGFIYSSGGWVHGSPTKPVNDLTPVGTAAAPAPPAKITGWRPQLERDIIAASDVLDVLVIRPAMVYGRSSSPWSFFFGPMFAASQSKSGEIVNLAANNDARPALVHVDDIASAFHCAVDKLSLIAGTGVYPIFIAGTSQESLRDILEASAKEFGVQIKFAGTGDVYAEAMSLSLNVSSGRIRSILGWQPKRTGGFVSGMGVFVRAWIAAQGQ